MIRPFVILILCLLALNVIAQKFPSRISPTLLSKPQAYFSDNSTRHHYLLDMGADAFPAMAGVEARHMGYGIWLVYTTPEKLRAIMSSVVPYRYIDEAPSPVADGGVLIYDMTANRINAAWNAFTGLRGQGQVVSVKENRMDTTDIDLVKRHAGSPLASPIGESHATAMTTLISGAGNSFFTGKGVAPRSRYSSSDFFTVLPDTPTYYTTFGIGIQNHSYGAGLQYFYGINARAFDLSVQQDPNLLHVFSAGNSGTILPSSGSYAGISGFANISGNMKMAKNILLTGAMDSAGNVPAFSSRGPAYDGRLAPHLIAFGEDGTSSAAALVSGSSLLIRQQFMAQEGRAPSASLLRAVLVNTTDDTGAEGPDYSSGYGKLNTKEALIAVRGRRYIIGQITAASVREFPITVLAGASLLKVTLGWSDPAAVTGVAKALVNDLDLELVAPSGQVLLPWILSSAPNRDSLLLAARRGMDTLNTLEQVSLKDPSPGVYTIRVRSAGIAGASQEFGVAFNWKAGSVFEWDHPVGNDMALAGSRAMLRWSSTYPASQVGILESSVNGGSWTLLDNAVDLGPGQYRVRLADTAHFIRYRMTIGSSVFNSAELMVSPALQNQFAYVCDTTILNYWRRLGNAGTYTLYRLVHDTLQAVLSTADTSATASTRGSSCFAVAPVIGGRELLRGPAVDYTKQAVGCYIDNLLADLVNEIQGMVTLELGTLFRLKRVEIIKVSRNNEVLLRRDAPTSRSYAITDVRLEQGINIYRAIAYLDDGTVRTSEDVSLYFLDKKLHIIYPNPQTRGNDIRLLSDQVEDETILIYDQMGRLFRKDILDQKNKTLPTRDLPQGMYHVRIVRQGIVVNTLRFVIR